MISANSALIFLKNRANKATPSMAKTVEGYQQDNNEYYEIVAQVVDKSIETPSVEVHRSTWEQYEPSYKVCPRCGKSMRLLDKYCYDCGQRVQVEVSR